MLVDEMVVDKMSWHHKKFSMRVFLSGPPGPSSYRPPGPGGYPPPGPQGYPGYPGQQGPPMGQVCV